MEGKEKEGGRELFSVARNINFNALSTIEEEEKKKEPTSAQDTRYIVLVSRDNQAIRVAVLTTSRSRGGGREGGRVGDEVPERG